MKTPCCKVCNNLSILADAGIFRSITYFYCKTCKFEVSEYGYEVKVLTEEIKSEEMIPESFPDIYYWNPTSNNTYHLVDDINGSDIKIIENSHRVFLNNRYMDDLLKFWD